MFILGLFSSAKDSILGTIRTVFLWLDMVSFSYLDNAYDLFYNLASQSIIEKTIIVQIIKNIYVLVGIFAFFRIAVFLINSIINPDSLQKEGAGLSKIFVNTVIMIVLLVAMPSIFEWSREITTKVVEKNYIQKLFVNPQEIEKNFSPGKEMQRIAIGTAISVEEDFLNSGTNDANSSCSGDCEKAVKCLNDINGIGDATNSECLSDTGVKWSKLSSYNGLSMKNASGEKLYVYNYKPLIITITGWFITYILLSFSFDVGKRMIELAILEILSPIFIATVVDPKSMSSGAFSRWLKEVKNSYLSLYLRIAAVSILLLCLRLLSYWKNPMSGGIAKLVVLLAFLMFVKQLPKWISNLLGMDGDGTGLGNLGIGKKIGEAALIGGLATKLGHSALGAGIGAARDAYAFRKANKERQKREGSSALERAKNVAREQRDAGANRRQQAKSYLGSYFSRSGAKQNFKNLGSTLAASGKGIVAGGISGAKIGFGTADIKDVNAKLKDEQKRVLNGAGYTSVFQKVGDKIVKKGSQLEESVIGTKAAQETLKKNMANKDLAEGMLGTKLYMNKDGDLFYDNAMTSPVAFDPKTIRKKFGGTVNGIEDVIASMVSGTKDSHFTTKPLTGQTYIDSSGNEVTTSAISAGTLVRDKKDANGRVITDVNGNAVKEAVINSNTGMEYKITDAEIDGAIKAYKTAAKDKTGSTGYEFTINDQTIHLTGQGVLEYEAAFAGMRDENANTWISVNERKASVTQQLAELQASFANAVNNLSVELSNTAYGKAERKKTEFQAQLDNANNLINEYESKLSKIDNDISEAKRQLFLKPGDPTIQHNLEELIREREMIKNERSKVEVNCSALENAISNCDAIMNDSANIEECNRIKRESNARVSAITSRIEGLKQESIDLTSELGTSISYGSDLIASVAGVEEHLTPSNSDRFLAETSRQKNKTRETADNYKKDNKPDSNK